MVQDFYATVLDFHAGYDAGFVCGKQGEIFMWGMVWTFYVRCDTTFPQLFPLRPH